MVAVSHVMNQYYLLQPYFDVRMEDKLILSFNDYEHPEDGMSPLTLTDGVC
jgi:hypothetical protein